MKINTKDINAPKSLRWRAAWMMNVKFTVLLLMLFQIPNTVNSQCLTPIDTAYAIMTPANCAPVGSLVVKSSAESEPTAEYKIIAGPPSGIYSMDPQSSNSFLNLPSGDYWIEINCSGQYYYLNTTVGGEPTPPVIGVTQKCGGGGGNNRILAAPTGLVVFEFAGYGPFKLEMKKTTDSTFITIGNAVPDKYTVDSLEAETAYNVKVTDQCGNISEIQIFVRAPEAGQVTNTQQPCQGQNYTLSAEDVAGASYSWTRDGVEISTSKDLVFPSYSSADDGKYTCVITWNGCIFKVATVNLNSEICGEPIYNSGIGNFVWMDSNMNGLQDDAETGVSGVQVILYAGDGVTPLDTTTTDAAGRYYFGNLLEGDYIIGFSNLPSGYSFTTSAGSASDAGNSDADTNGKTGVITLANNEFNLNIDAGIKGALPVTLISFTAKKVETTVVLTWATSMESNSDRFEIENSFDGKSWQKIGTVFASKESSSVKNYHYTHTNPTPGDALYRLRMIDADTRFTFSRIQHVRTGNSDDHAVLFPNPASEKLFLNPDLIASVSEVSLTDITGRVLYQAGAFPVEGIDVDKLSAGIYVVRTKLRNGVEKSSRVLVVKQ